MIPCAVARNMQTMLVARFLDGLAGSAFLSVAGGTVGDMFSRSVSGKAADTEQRPSILTRPQELSAPMMIYSAAPFM